MIPKFKIFLFLAMVVLSQVTFAQRTELRKADNLYESRDYYQALEYYNAAVEKGDETLETKLRITRCYFHLKDIQAAFDNYLNLEGDLKEVEDLLNYAACYQQEGAYELAIEWYNKAKSAGANPIDVDEMVKACVWAGENGAYNPSVRVNPAADLPMGGQSFGIQFYKDEIVYSGEKEGGSNKVDNVGKGYLNLFSSKYVDGEIQEGSKSFSKYLEYDFHIGATAFTSDFNRIYYTKVVKLKGGGSRIKIFTAEFSGKDWSGERELSVNSDDYDVVYPAVSNDDKYLFFASDMRGGLGGQDIYKAPIKPNGDVGRPENLGRDINTFGNEQWPYISKYGDLYFASDGRLGFGGLDIYKAQNVDGKYTNVVNMRQPINSGKDDFGFVLDPNDIRRGFLSSNRIGSGNLDGLFVMIPTDTDVKEEKETIPIFDETVEEDPVVQEPVVTQEPVIKEEPVVVQEPETKVEVPVVVPIVEQPVVEEPVVEEAPKVDLSAFPEAFSTKLTSTYQNELIDGALVEIKDANTGETVATGISEADGKVNIIIPDEYKKDDQEFEVVLSKGTEYNSKRMIVHIMEIEDINRNGLSLTPIFKETSLNEIGKFVIPYRGTEITEEGKAICDELAVYLLQHPNVVVKLNGHTEARGVKYDNLQNSQIAAEKAEEYLMKKGVSDDNMIPRGYGERYLLNKCKRGIYCEESEHLENRRIEVVVWKILN